MKIKSFTVITILKHNLTVGYAILENAKQLSNVMDTLNASSGSVNNEMNTYLDSTEAKFKQLKESVVQFWQSLISSDMTKGVMDGLNGLMNIFGNVPTVVGLAIASLVAFKGEAMAGCVVALGGFITALGKCIAEFGLFKTAQMEINLLLAKNPFIAIAMAITGTIVAVKQLTDAYKENHDWQAKLSENVDSMKSNTEASTMLEQAREYQQALQDQNLTTEEANVKKKALLGLEEQLAQKFPELISGYNAQGNAIATNMDKIEKAIEVSSKNALISATANYNNLFDELNSGKVTFGIGDWGLVKESESAVEKYNELRQIQGEMTSRQSDSFKDAINDLNSINDQVISIYQAGGDISNYKMFDFDTGEWVEAKSVIEGATDSVNGFGTSLDEAEQEANDLSEALQQLSGNFDLLKGEIGIIDDIVEEFKEYGQITDDTASNLISKYPDLLVLMSQEGFVMQDLIDYQQKLRIEKQNTLNEAVRDANLDAQTVMKCENIKRAEDNSTNYLRRTNSVTTTNNLGSNYVTDTNNFGNSADAKSSTDASLHNALRQNGAMTANELADFYTNDVNNFVEAQKAKERASNQYLKTLLGNFLQTQALQTGMERYNNFKNLNEYDENTLKEYNNPYKDDLIKKGYKYQPGNGWILSSKGEVAVTPNAPNISGQNNVDSGSFKKITSTATPAKDSSSKKANSSSGKADKTSTKTERKVEDVENLKDRYYALNNELNILSKNLTEVESKLKYSVGSQYKNYLNQQIDLYEKLRETTQKTIDEELRERWDLRVKLDANGFRFNEKEEITNYAEIMDRKWREANAHSNPDDKENAIKEYKKLSQVTKDYADLVFAKIPQLKGQMEDYANSIKDVYKEMTSKLSDMESKVYETAKYYAEKTTNAKKEAIERQMDLIDKMRSKEEDSESLATKQSELAEIKAEMDKYLYDTTASGRKKLKDLQKEYNEALKNLNDTIADQQYNSMKDVMEQEKEDLDKTLENFLDPENIRSIISDAIGSGQINILDSTYELDKAMTNMLSETKTGTQELVDANTEWIHGLQTVASLYSEISKANSHLGNISNINTGGFKATNSPELLKDISNIGKYGNVSAPISITINGNADKDTLEDLEEMMEAKVNELYKAIKG